MSGQPWLKFYPADWRQDPALRMCSLAARGLWMEMLCLMWQATPCGSLLVNGRQVTPRQLAPLVGTSAKEAETLVDELGEAGVFSRDEDGTIYSRRMRRDVEKAGRQHANGLQGGHPNIRRGTVPKAERMRRFRKSDSPEKAKRIFDRENGRCHWCHIALDPSLWHADHVVGIADGGSNDEDNIVAACASCNGRRALIYDPTISQDASDPMVGKITDHKAQKLEARSQKPEAAAAAPQSFDAECRLLVGQEPVLLAQDFHAITALLAEGLTKDDVRTGITEALQRADLNYRFRAWRNFEKWVRTAAQNRLAGKPRTHDAKPSTPDNPDDPVIDFGGGITSPLSTLQMFVARGTWVAQWGPGLGDPGCRVPEPYRAELRALAPRREIEEITA